MPSRVWFLYNCYQEMYEKMQKEATSKGIEFKLRQASDLTEEDLKSMRALFGQTLICIDDSTISVSFYC